MLREQWLCDIKYLAAAAAAAAAMSGAALAVQALCVLHHLSSATAGNHRLQQDVGRAACFQQCKWRKWRCA
jgi:hypothetical protein